MAATMEGAQPGYNGAVRYRGRVIGCIGLSGDPVQVRPLQRMAAQIVVDALEKSEQEIKEAELRREAVEKINDIADNMKVLALNGSIQAAKLGARAGGFKVVAQEMKHLAESINSITHHFQR
jgi:carbohydrate diacid regulator